MFVYSDGSAIMAVKADGTRLNLLTNRKEEKRAAIGPYTSQIANEQGILPFVKGTGQDAEIFINEADGRTRSIGNYAGEIFLTFSGDHLLLIASADEVRHINIMNGDDYIINVRANAAFVAGNFVYFAAGRKITTYDLNEYEIINTINVPSCKCTCSNLIESVTTEKIQIHCWSCGATGYILDGSYYASTQHSYKGTGHVITYEQGARRINYTYLVPINYQFEILQNYLIVWIGDIYSVININGFH